MIDRIGPRKPFRHYIREWMEYKDVSQERLAGRMDVESGTISKLLNGHMRMSDKWLTGIATALDVEVADLFRDPRQPTREELLAGLDDEQVRQIIQIIDTFRKTGTEG